MKKSNTSVLYLIIIATLFLFMPASGHAQYRPAIDVQEWPTGKIVLTSGDTIYGPITFYRTQEIIQLQDEQGNLQSFSPVNVKYFVTQEQPSGRPYTFRALMWNLGRDYSDFKKPTFFEQLNQGAVTLYMREEYVHVDPNRVSQATMKQFYNPQTYETGEWLNQIKALYYVELPNGEVVTLRNVRKDLHRLFGKKSGDVKDFVKEHRLGYERPHQLVAIVNYFNSLSSLKARGEAEVVPEQQTAQK